MRKYLDYLNGILMALMFTAIFFQIVARAILSVPTSWSVESGILLFAFIIFIGIASITRERSHLRVDTLVIILPAKVQKIIEFIGNVLIVVFSFFLLVGAFRNMIANWTVEIPTIEWFHWGYVYLVIVIATVITVVYQILNMIEDCRGAKNK